MTSRQEWHDLLERSNRAGLQFVITELDFALSTLHSADLHSDIQRRELARKTAHQAYDTAIRCLQHLTPSASQRTEISAKAREIERRLSTA
jgi:GH35 family endo-1,4-beta-xylanase